MIIALHGFPDLPISYRHQLPVLAENGYRVIAPYMHGYFPSDTSSDDVCDIAIFVQDIMALIAQLTNQSTILIGHDWGAVVSRIAAILAPDKISKIACMSVPTAGNFRRALISNSAQQRRS
jgi:pimeloyl-ACP methyl ester carboxylesterase